MFSQEYYRLIEDGLESHFSKLFFIFPFIFKKHSLLLIHQIIITTFLGFPNFFNFLGIKIQNNERNMKVNLWWNHNITIIIYICDTVMSWKVHLRNKKRVQHFVNQILDVKELL